MTKAQKAERAEAIDKLRSWIKPGDTVYTILDHVSSSGMSRAIRVVLPDIDYSENPNGGRKERVPVTFLHPNWAVGKALGLRHWKRNGREQDALVVGGCGMDMGFHLVYELSHVLYGAGYRCLGKGLCPSNYHRNYRSHVMCQELVDHPASGKTSCKFCDGSGYLANPEGPERFDLVHTDGYALRHRWL